MKTFNPNANKLLLFIPNISTTTSDFLFVVTLTEPYYPYKPLVLTRQRLLSFYLSIISTDTLINSCNSSEEASGVRLYFLLLLEIITGGFKNKHLFLKTEICKEGVDYNCQEHMVLKIDFSTLNWNTIEEFEEGLSDELEKFLIKNCSKFTQEEFEEIKSINIPSAKMDLFFLF